MHRCTRKQGPVSTLQATVLRRELLPGETRVLTLAPDLSWTHRSQPQIGRGHLLPRTVIG